MRYTKATEQLWKNVKKKNSVSGKSKAGEGAAGKTSGRTENGTKYVKYFGTGSRKTQ